VWSLYSSADLKQQHEISYSWNWVPLYKLFHYVLFLDMASLYEFLTTSGVLEKDAELLDAMKQRIEEEIKKFDEK
jgi:hypothetical protein